MGETGKFSCTRRSVSAVNTMVSAVLSSRSAVLLFKPYSDVPCHHLFEWVVAHCLYFSDSLSRTKCTCSGTVTLANFASNCKKIYFRPQSELHRTPDLHQSRDANPKQEQQEHASCKSRGGAFARLCSGRYLPPGAGLLAHPSLLMPPLACASETQDLTN